MDSELIYALKISGVGIVVLLLVLVALAGVVSLMTKFIVEKPKKEEEPEEEKAVAVTTEKSSNLETVAAIALALYRAQTEIQTSETSAPAGEINSWRQFNLQRRLTQSSTIRRTR